MPTWKRELPFESCVLNYYTECQALNAFQLGAVPYFCGQSDVCMTPCQAAVDKAIDNINKHYGAIGLIEDFVHSIALFEQTMPKMFGNMTEIVSDILLKDVRRRVAKPYKKDLEVMKTMSERMFFENQLYKFIKKRFYTFLVHFNADEFVESKLDVIGSRCYISKKKYCRNSSWYSYESNPSNLLYDFRQIGRA